MSFPVNALYSLILPRRQPAPPPDAETPGSTSSTTEASGRRSSATAANDETFSRVVPLSVTPAPYDTPDVTGRCWLVELPEEVLARVFERLDRVSLSRCARVCKTISDLLRTNPRLALQPLLASSSLSLNPAILKPSNTNPLHIPPSPAELLARLNDRLERFDNFRPRREIALRLKEPEGRLYEYLEGVLLRGVGTRGALPRELAVYDLRQLRSIGLKDGGGTREIEDEGGMQEGEETMENVGEAADEEDDDEWEEVDESEELAEKIRRTKKFNFDIAEFAVDPGQDLLVIVEVKTHDPRQHSIIFHLLSLETFEQHPLARHPTLEWPSKVLRRTISLGFQICDDGFFVLNHNVRQGQYDQICGWQWTTGRLAATLKAFPTMTFESFILLSPNSILVPTIVTHVHADSEHLEDLNNPVDLFWTHHLYLYAFPPLGSVPISPDPSEPIPPPHSVTPIVVFDLPTFVVDLTDEMPPPRMTIRTDPPPRHTFPSHPIDNVSPFAPQPESGVIILEFFCQLPDAVFPHYVLACPKRALIRYLPAPTSPLLVQAFPRSAPVVPWDKLAPKVRMFGPDMKSSSWVCYVYQDRYVVSTSLRHEGDPPDRNAKARLYDFNPLRVKREILRRTPASPSSPSTSVVQFVSPPSESPPPPKKRSILRRLSSSLSGSSSSAGPSGSTSAVADIDGERNGVMLVTAETTLRKALPLQHEVKTGRDFPYTYVERPSSAEVFLLDEERIIAVHNTDDEDPAVRRGRNKSMLEVMEF